MTTQPLEPRLPEPTRRGGKRTALIGGVLGVQPSHTRQSLPETAAVRSHHDYPAFDVGLPPGTPIYAITAGTITTAIGDSKIYEGGDAGRCGNTIMISGIDGATYTYCHLTAVLVAPGQPVEAGQLIGASGGQPGTPGAGNTTGPHLHLGVRVYGQSVCPQPLLLAIIAGTPIPPTAAPATGCYHPGPTTNWNDWLSAV